MITIQILETNEPLKGLLDNLQGRQTYAPLPLKRGNQIRKEQQMRKRGRSERPSEIVEGLELAAS
jgi:hypothetical protein